MCGIAGFWESSWNENARQIGLAMAEQIAHRGPDDAGVWSDEHCGVTLAHRRLSIVDLSAAGHQPMLSDCGRFVISFNGEIYNHQDLRRELASSKPTPHWRGHSDTETLLICISRWGIALTLQKLNGMFAFALWDREQRQLILARDRMGEKPLYFGVAGNSFLFGSELKALRVHPAWIGKIDRDALALFFRHQYVPSPHSIYQGICKLQPAHYAVIRKEGPFSVETCCYWDLESIAQSGLASSSQSSPADLQHELHDLLQDSVSKRLMADVPVGAFLSGGYDSSMVVALAQQHSSMPLKTFSIGFNESGYDEAPHARAVAAHLGTEHIEHYVSPDEAMSVIPDLPRMWCEPFADSSQIPTYLVSALAKQQVKVSLSGDGGDELFYGYSRYFLAERIWGKAALVPRWVRRAASATLNSVPGPLYDAIASVFPAGSKLANFSDRVPKLASMLSQPDLRMFYRELISHWKQPEQLVLSSSESETLFTSSRQLSAFSPQEMMMFADMLTYLPEDILVKVDRASMANSLEARVPLLDHRLVELAWRIPTSLKHSDTGGKQILKNVLHQYVPESLMNRPKMGFGVPIDEWLRGPLREWAESLLNEARLDREGYLNSRLVAEKWREHLSGERRWHYYLWDVLMFQAWLEQEQLPLHPVTK